MTSVTAITRSPSVRAHRLYGFTTPHPADVVDVLPAAAAASAGCADAFVAVGCYELLPSSGARVGCVELHSASASSARLCHRHIDDAASAVFDLRWSGRGGGAEERTPPLLGVAEARGCVAILALSQLPRAEADEGEGPSPLPSLTPLARAEADVLSPLHAHSAASPPPSCLYLDWASSGCSSGHPADSDPTSRMLAVSLSSGHVALLSLLPSSSSLCLLSTFHPHRLEVWSCAFSTATPTSLYTGSDDAQLSRIDCRSALSSPLAGHPAGVTAILPLPSSSAADEVLVTGCYDERVRVWDLRAMRRPMVEKGLGGGVWRLRRRAGAREREGCGAVLCAACMHGGLRVLRLSGDGRWDVEVVSEYYEHQSLAYGCDWLSSEAEEKEEEEAALISCSFYDRSVHVWRAAVRGGVG